MLDARFGSEMLTMNTINTELLDVDRDMTKIMFLNLQWVGLWDTCSLLKAAHPLAAG